MTSKERAHRVSATKWRSDDVKLQEKAEFTSLLLSDNVLAGLGKSGFQVPSPIQLEAIPVGRFGQDLVVQAKSGTGKTLVFTIIALESMEIDVKKPQVLVLAPTREIAFQICSVIKTVGSEFKDLKCCTFIGGTSLGLDKEQAQDCQIAVGSPGRIKQLISVGLLKTDGIRLLVLDEADKLLDNSFISDVDAIFITLPHDKQVIATSATYPKKLQKLVGRFFRKPFLARLNENDLALKGMVHYIHFVETTDMPVIAYRRKLKALESILSTVTFSQCLVFCNMISRVEQICSDIRKWGFSTAYISSAKEQSARLRAIDKLKRFKCKVLVSSDLTARGIDAENVDLVINFDAPPYKEVYLHRVGRAGRYGTRGAAITFVNETQLNDFNLLKKEGNFTSYYLPDPIPANLISMRPYGFVERVTTEQISYDSSEEPIAENSAQEERDLGSVNKSSDNKMPSENADFQVSVDDTKLLESSVAESFELVSSFHEGVDSNLCPSSDVQTNLLEGTQNENNVGTIPLDSNTERATSSLSDIGKPILKEEKAKEDSVIDDTVIKKSRMKKTKKSKVQKAGTFKNVADLDESSIKNLELEARTENISISETEENMSQIVSEMQCAKISDNANLGEMYTTISDFIVCHEKAQELILEKAKAPEGVEDSQKATIDIIKLLDETSSNQEFVSSERIADMTEDLKDYYYTVLNSFTNECMPNKPEASLPKKDDETEKHEVLIEKETTSEKSLLDNEIQKENELSSSEETESTSEIESVLESTPIQPKNERRLIAKSTNDSSDSSSSSSSEESNILMLSKRFKEFVRKSYQEQPSASGLMPQLSKNTCNALTQSGAVFISTSEESSESIASSCDEKPSESSSDSDDYEIQRSRHHRGRKASSASRSATITSGDSCKSTRLSKHHNRRQPRHNSISQKTCQVNHNQACSTSFHPDERDVSRSYQTTCNIGNGHYPCTYSMGGHSHLSGSQYTDQQTCNGIHPIPNQCNFPSNSGSQSHLYNQWYETFHRQWQSIHYSSYFE